MKKAVRPGEHRSANGVDARVSRGIQPRCPVCSEEPVPPVHTCPTCFVVYHQECWSYNGRCGIFGCGAQPKVRHADRQAPISTVSESSGLGANILAAVGVFVLLAVFVVSATRMVVEALPLLTSLGYGHAPFAQPSVRAENYERYETVWVCTTSAQQTKDAAAHLHRLFLCVEYYDDKTLRVSGRSGALRVALSELQSHPEFTSVYYIPFSNN